jgi:lipopolysaccharide export system protein LptA
MNLSVRHLRKWLVIAMSALVLVVAGFYTRGYYTRYLLSKAIQKNAEKLGVDIQQSTDNFSFSKSEGGHTLFTVRASKAIQVKSGRAELHEVNIVVYGRDSNRFDQIYGSDFEYDPKSGEVRAQGEVHIDLQGVAEGDVRPDQAPPKELKNPIHLLTSGLVFNRDTGVAHTSERIEFRIPQASGSAVGATYDSRAQELTLHSQIELKQSGETPARLVASRAVITNTGPRVDFTNARISRPGTDVTAQRLSVLLRDDNTIQHVSASGDVRAQVAGTSPAVLTSPKADVYVDTRNRLTNAEFSGGVTVDAAGDQALHGKASRLLLDFGAANQLQKVRAVNDVELTQEPPRGKQNSQALTLTANGVTMNIDPSGRRGAQTVGPAQIVLASSTLPPIPANAGAVIDRIAPSGAAKTIATADKFVATFAPTGKLTALVGTPNAKVVSSAPDQPDKVTTSNLLTLTVKPDGGLSSVVQEGAFHFTEAPDKSGKVGTEATANRATFDPATELFVLSGSPRLTDSGITVTADRVRINRKTGDAMADGTVKTTYSQIQERPDGALFAAGDPIHVTAATMTARRSDDSAHYAGGARLWQGANIVEAPTIDFNRTNRTVIAQGTASRRVSTVFAEQGQAGKQTPVNVTGQRLTYEDSQRQAKFEGGVVMRSSEGTLTADHLTVFLQPRGPGGNATQKSASTLDKVVAEGRVVLQQEGRRGTGNRLVYNAGDRSFRLTGGPPSIFDAEHGQVTGDSLTFFSRDDRVLVEGGNSAPSVTKARVIK